MLTPSRDEFDRLCSELQKSKSWHWKMHKPSRWFGYHGYQYYETDHVAQIISSLKSSNTEEAKHMLAELTVILEKLHREGTKLQREGAALLLNKPSEEEYAKRKLWLEKRHFGKIGNEEFLLTEQELAQAQTLLIENWHETLMLVKLGEQHMLLYELPILKSTNSQYSRNAVFLRI